MAEAAGDVAPALERGMPLVAIAVGEPFAGRQSRGGSLPVRIDLA